ncbi:class I SAM-dependent methyltransferase [Aspergillus vadensis CBS 113365]|uniref:SAM-dependent methyltransferase n=1 Tax=Aspergillus vadensis (strain CBS 113365 / IMI 142717 / IBT 24658) TaxID=1448311 RepID=A0A319BJS1_ASPVC|nr:SAM-dependent methyltransferase [Aspergillus vadensis CBS 113365]PYH72965.1 SAM-dependent methyltransferase [Aspergillus vadensis CBS 113365]
MTASPKTPSALEEGIALYTPFLLRYFYDFWVLWVSNNFAWKCPTSTVQLPLFNAAMGQSHLDIGVGTGYYPAKSLKAGAKCTEVTLLDLSPNSLQAAEQRILETVGREAVRVNTVVASALEPLPFDKTKKFNSISVFFLLHCIPGTPEEKCKLFDVVRPHLAEDGVLVGTTVLGQGVPINWLGQKMMNSYNNNTKSFHNSEDNKAQFDEGLRRNFEEVESWVMGQVMLFKARKPRQQHDVSNVVPKGNLD